MFGIELFDHIGEAQIGPVAGECRAHQGMHLSANDLFFEFVDPSSREPAKPGAVGELIATHLGPRALPLVRYAPGDAYRILDGDCPCGNPAPRVEFFGQVGAIRKIKGVLIHPIAIADFLGALPGGRAGFRSWSSSARARASSARSCASVVRDGALLGTSASARARRSASRRRAREALLISMDVEACAEAEIPAEADGPGFAAAIVERAAA